MLASFAACGKKEPSKVPQEGGYDAGGNYVPTIPDVSKELEQAVKDNSDVIGWLQVPDTKINEPVVQTTDNEYYLRRDYKKNYSYAGCYYLDYESVLFDEARICRRMRSYTAITWAIRLVQRTTLKRTSLHSCSNLMMLNSLKKRRTSILQRLAESMYLKFSPYFTAKLI